jgi:hypothetical protein
MNKFVSIKFISTFVSETNTKTLTTMKTKIISKTVKPARRCQNFNHWAEYIKQTVQTIKLKQDENNR